MPFKHQIAYSKSFLVIYPSSIKLHRRRKKNQIVLSARSLCSQRASVLFLLHFIGMCTECAFDSLIRNWNPCPKIRILLCMLTRFFKRLRNENKYPANQIDKVFPPPCECVCIDILWVYMCDSCQLLRFSTLFQKLLIVRLTTSEMWMCEWGVIRCLFGCSISRGSFYTIEFKLCRFCRQAPGVLWNRSDLVRPLGTAHRKLVKQCVNLCHVSTLLIFDITIIH